MEKKIGKIKKFFEEFKKFITRGNVLDMAVGVIVGGAFTAIVNGLSNFILKPLINALLAIMLGDGALEGAVTILGKPAMMEDGVTIDLANSIYIDWGSFISAVINFFIIAFVLFTIIKMFNRISEAQEKMREGLELTDKKEIAKIRREQKVSKKEARVILEQRKEEIKAKQAEEARVAAEKAAAEAAAAEAKATANTRLLEEIRDLLKNK